MQASWQPAALTEPRALADFSHVQRSLEELRKARPHFDVVTRAPHLRFSLVDELPRDCTRVQRW